ncbi:MAG: GntR family transcriptional regulator [Lachnospiraceae bacterium]|nr:GntR family transcriptional regulator [Lachnospiraceae bacterium]
MSIDNSADNRDEMNFLPLRDVVFEKLKTQIMEGELTPGTRLMEIGISEKLGVSRTPVREAIRMLEKEGLAVILPRRGAHVASVSPRQLEDMLEVRRTLETFSVNAAGARITEKDIADLRSINKKYLEVMDENDYVQIARVDHEFHSQITKIAGNEKILSILEGLKEQLFRYTYLYAKYCTTLKETAEEHEMICDAFLKGDSNRAVEIIKMHIDHQQLVVYLKGINEVISKG